MSVPNQLAADGGRRRLSGSMTTGSVVPSHGARIATIAVRLRSTRPTIAMGWRRPSRASPARAPRTGPVVGVTSAPLIGSVANPRIEDRVEEVDGEVDEDVHGRDDQHHALDDRVVSPQDGVDRQAADPGDGEDALGDDRPADEQR